MATFVVPHHGEIHVPSWVVDLESFLRWVDSGVLPEKFRVHFLRGEVWTEEEMEEVFTHNLVKTVVTSAIQRLVEENEEGLVFSDGVMLVNEAADIATVPDAIYVTNKTMDRGRVKFFAGATGGGQATRMKGSPDLALEIVSPSSEDKDTEWLMSAYWNAGIKEYWLIDARRDDPEFDVYKRGSRGFSTSRKRDGWVKSAVLDREFRLVRKGSRQGFPIYRLEVR